MKNPLENTISKVWEDLQPATRHLLERALVAAPQSPVYYEGGTEGELSRLLVTLDQYLAVRADADDNNAREQLKRVAETCAAILQRQTRTAETFAQLIIRANRLCDFTRLHELGEALATRGTPGEICELARHPYPVVNALALEILVHLPTHLLAALLDDPLDAPLAHYALEQQAIEYDCEAAQSLLMLWEDDAGELAI